MNRQKLMAKKILFFYFLMGIGIFGLVLFFPVHIDRHHTCLFHRISGKESTDPLAVFNVSTPEIDNRIPPVGHRRYWLIREYVLPFGFLWWGSIVTLVVGFFMARRNINQRTPDA